MLFEYPGKITRCCSDRVLPGIYTEGFRYCWSERWLECDPTYARRPNHWLPNWCSKVRFQLYTTGTLKAKLPARLNVVTATGPGRTTFFGTGKAAGKTFAY